MHILTDDQNGYEYKPLSKCCKYVANNVTGDESRVHSFEPVIKIGNKILLTKHGIAYSSLVMVEPYKFRCRRTILLIQVCITEMLC